jgi:cell division protein FtsB
MNSDYNLTIKTVRHSDYADEYEGREGLIKLPYKLLLQQSEIRNGQLQSDNDELRDKVDALNAKIAELEAENNDRLVELTRK